MKKLLFTLLGAGAMISASAATNMPDMLQSTSLYPASKKTITTVAGKNSKPVLTRAGENTYQFGYCAGIGTGVGYPAGSVLEAAIEIPTYMSKGWKGMKITKVYVGFGYSSNKNINLYITEDLNGVPAYMQEAEMKVEAIKIVGNQVSIDQDWNEVVLDTPYEIDGNPFYLGYQVLCEGNPCYPIGFDLIYSENEMGDILGAPDGPNGEMVYYNMGTVLGSVSLRFEMEGDMPNEYDAITDTIFLDNNVFGKDDQFNAGFTLLNIGSETITGLDLSCTIDGVDAEDLHYTIYGEEEGSIPFGVLGYVEVTGFAPSSVSGVDLPFEVTISALKSKNGEGKINEKLSTEVTIPETTFKRNIVVEEFTGTWCGWCPRGIVGMEYMRVNYGKRGFIGIAAHSGDAMEAPSYVDVINYYSQNSFPSAVVNRMDYFDPSVETLQQYFNALTILPALAKVDLTAQYDEEANTLTATATAEFGVETDNGEFGFAFVITEDNVGPYVQTNYFSGGLYGETLEGWTEKSAKVSTIFEMVARDITDGFGIEGSLPAEIKGNTPYSYTTKLPLGNVKNINECEVIALLLNLKTGEVVNAAQVSLKGQAGIESLEAPADGFYRVYNLQGVKMIETKEVSEINVLPQGIYIINGKKVVIK